ncbi:hypothetical protein AQUCO_02700114v1 [Aquilegia coerulea]|uniref:Uncharacterized protein n=1 Tax=Aquilegia coerulea TaxID=218851 RepID=A0A2G5D570_AQUCA|nr:hypothetical protein AQUCO_02700114v1 [Aquilegia coerulea]PIA38661.1 hypothetical protein AQUCO_02700114v1 [Aquilegia coerulea]PIA38662.1 hypothetical protein AQUCO_02700114v1 [Aquilegia coerulea]
MQPSKTRATALEVPQRTSPVTPQRASPVTPRTARQLKTSSESDSASSQPASRTPKDKSPKVTERKSPRSPVSERKRPSKISELESQLSQLQDDLKKTKDQLVSSESCKRHAQQEAEEAQKQLIVLAEKHDESQRQLLELSASEEDRLQELRKISQERDKAWESELDAVQKQHSVESAALASALSEIQRLKIQLELVVDSEAGQIKDADETHTELQSLQLDLQRTRSVIEDLKAELDNCKQSEAQAQEMVSDTLRQLETARMTVETLRLDGIKTMEAYNSLSLELEQSRARAYALEEIVSKLQMDVAIANCKHSSNSPVHEMQSPIIAETTESNQLGVELNTVKSEVGDLRSALEAVEIKYQEEQIQSTMKIHSAYELVEEVKSKAGLREAELESELKRTKTHIEELKANLMDKETELQSISEENEGLSMKIEKTLLTQRQPELNMEVNKSKADIEDLKASLMDKETKLQMIYEENKMLKSEIQKRETESKVNDEVISETEAARAAEKEALMKLGYVTEQAEKNSRRAERATEQLEAAQVANLEMEAELRRLKVQSDQWRKAAEAAAAVLSAGNNAKCIDRSGSFESNYHPITGKICSPYSEDMDDDSPKKKNMLKKLGSLWKKGQK